jgi:hypothetical protein
VRVRKEMHKKIVVTNTEEIEGPFIPVVYPAKVLPMITVDEITDYDPVETARRFEQWMNGNVPWTFKAELAKRIRDYTG